MIDYETSLEITKTKSYKGFNIKTVTDGLNEFTTLGNGILFADVNNAKRYIDGKTLTLVTMQSKSVIDDLYQGGFIKDKLYKNICETWFKNDDTITTAPINA